MIRVSKIIFMFMTVCTVLAGTDLYAEELNCMLCHKYYGMNRIDANGDIRVSYINEALYARSPHRHVECNECHKDISEIPHKKIKAVDCTSECHVKEPSGNKKFSHKKVAERLKGSVHSSYDKDGKKKKYPEDYPACKDCHEQPLYRDFTKSIGHDGDSEKSLKRCKNCHTEGEFASDFYAHVTARLHRQRNSNERIDLCAKCHADKALIKRHELSDVIGTYKETFHYKMIRMGSEKTPDCVDCHDVSSVNGHKIKSKKDPESSVHPDNVGQTCKQAGCHEKASAKLAGFQTHVTYEVDKYPLQHYMLLFFRVIMTIILYGFLIVVFLELVRRLFPNIVLFKKRTRRER